MKKLCKYILPFIVVFLAFSTAYSTSIPNKDDPTTFLGPIARIGFTSNFGDSAAYSLAGEAGAKNFRAGATLGFKLTESQRLKISAEFLRQEITYAFFSGNTDQWVNQGAIGAAYQLDLFDASYKPQFDLTAYGSHAPNKNLHSVSGSFVNSLGVLTLFNNTRRIAGSNAAGIAPGLAIAPWAGGRLSAAVNYDSVRYDTKYSPDEDAIGWGGTLGFSQAITETVGFGVAASVRQPYNNYAANISWSNVPYFGRWKVALFGNFNDGKNTLPDTYNVGLGVDYFLDQRCETVPANLKGERNLKGEVATVTRPVSDNLLAWTADPAVYMPQVLAIVDQRVETPQACTLVRYLGVPGEVPPDFPNGPPSFTYDMSPLFSGSDIVYSISVTVLDSSGASPDDFSINPNTGLLTYDTETFGGYSVTVTGRNACGRASVTFEYFND